MKWPALATVVAAGVILAGCDQLPFFGRGAESAATDTATAPAGTPVEPAAPAQPAGADQQAAAQQQAAAEQQAPAQQEAAPPQPQATPPQEAQPTPRQAARARQPSAQPVLADEPWAPQFTGTVEPGMTTDEVIATWGPPVAERTVGPWTYLYFRNGCEVTCGTFDVVFLQDGQVVDAIVRGRGHTYSGVSSSPPGQPALFTPPGTTMDEGGGG
jgi:hypothetical protein